MAFSLSEAHEIQADVCHAVVRHRDQLLTVILRCSHEEALALPPEFAAEIDHSSVVRFEANLPQDDSESGFFPTDDPSVILADGQIHHHLKIDPDYVLLDVYTQSGPEYFTVTSEDIEGTVPAVGSRLRVWLLGLFIYPTKT